MATALWIVQGFLALGALYGFHHFIVVRRFRLSLWAMVNACSVLALMLLACSLLRLRVPVYLLTGMMIFYGAESLLILPWRGHPALIIALSVHVAMILISFLLPWSRDIHLLPVWIGGVALGFLGRHASGRILAGHPEVRPLLSDPVIGQLFRHVGKIDLFGVRDIPGLLAVGASLHEILPHRPPMVLIDTLVRCDATSATATKTFWRGTYGLDGRRVSEPALIECLAQTVAALSGYQARAAGRPPSPGMLVGVSNFEFPSPATSDREILLDVEITHQFGNLSLASGTAKQGDHVVADGTLKFHVGEPAHAAA